jgi:CRISPR-associated protein Cas8b1/Cst1 subtype I-B
MKIKAALPDWMGGDSFEEQRADVLEEVAKLQKQLSKNLSEEDRTEKLKELEDLNKKLKFLNAETGNT